MTNKTNENLDNNVNSNENKEIETHISNTMHQNTNGNVQSTHMTVHSAPLNLLNKNIATPLNQNDLINRKMLEQNFNNLTGENSNAYQNGIKASISENNNTTSNTQITNYQVSLNF